MTVSSTYQCVLHGSMFYMSVSSTYQCVLHFSMFYMSVSSIYLCVLHGRMFCISVSSTYQCVLHGSVFCTPGWLKDNTGSYNIVFYTALTQGVFSFIVIIAIVCCTGQDSPDVSINTSTCNTDDDTRNVSSCKEANLVGNSNAAFVVEPEDICTHF